jgi:hypothetical protein
MRKLAEMALDDDESGDMGMSEEGEGDDYSADLEAEAQKFSDATAAGDAKGIAAAFRAMHDICNEKG